MSERKGFAVDSCLVLDYKPKARVNSDYGVAIRFAVSGTEYLGVARYWREAWNIAARKSRAALQRAEGEG